MPESGRRRIAVIGGGAMGTACVAILCENPAHRVQWWVRSAEQAAEIARTRENRRYVPGCRISGDFRVTSDAAAALAEAEWVVVAVPSAYLRSVASALAEHVPPRAAVISAIKGIEQDGLNRPSEILQAEWHLRRPVVVLGGPSHAEELLRRLPASVVAACDDLELARAARNLLLTDRFRVYSHSDPVGVEWAGALKNVIAIAAGVCDGLGLGDNAKSALMTRGLAEMARFGTWMGARAETFSGLAGIGDLITTCVSPHGRNRRVGERLGQGESLETIRASMTAVAEGISTADSVHRIARRHGIPMPITQAVHAVLYGGVDPRDAAESLMLRPPRDEFDTDDFTGS